MKLCIIGGSGHFDYVLNGLPQLPDVELVAVAPGSHREDMSKLHSRLAQCALSPRNFSNWQEMLDSTQPDIVVVNPHFGDHGRINKACLLRGVHLYAEKPLATSLDELAELKTLWLSGQSHLAAMFGIRYKPWFMAAWQAVNAGKIGAVRQMHAQKSYKLGQRPDFFAQRASFGGLIPWVGCHAIDWLRWFSGEEFVSVFARHSTLHNGGQGDLEASAICAFEMSHEVLATVSIDYLRPSAALGHDDDRIRIVGSQGVIEVRDKTVWLLNDQGQQEIVQAPEIQCFADFCQSIRGESTCVVSAQDAFLSTTASLKARESADTRTEIRF